MKQTATIKKEPYRHPCKVLIDGQWKVFPSQTALGRYIGVQGKSVSNAIHLKGNILGLPVKDLSGITRSVYRPNAKGVIVFNPDGTIKRQLKSLMEASNYLDHSITYITRCLDLKSRTPGFVDGWRVLYAEDYVPWMDYSYKYRPTKLKSSRRTNSRKKYHRVRVLDIDTGDEWPSITACARELGCSMQNVRQTLRKSGKVKGRRLIFIYGQQYD